MMEKNYKRMSHDELKMCIDILCTDLSKYINNNKLKIDYICPILRSGAIPAVYIANQLNIVKFAPIQVKHISYKNGENKTELIFNPFNSIEIKKKNPVFLVVDAMYSTGTSAKICINEIKNKYKDAKILYVCIAKEYNSTNLGNKVIYENFAFYCNEDNKLNKEKCKEFNIEYSYPLFPWENLDIELKHPDDLEENIFF